MPAATREETASAINHVVHALTELRRLRPGIRIVPRQDDTSHFSPEHGCTFRIELQEVPSLVAIGGVDPGSTIIRVCLTQRQSYVKEVEYYDDTPMLTDDGLVLYVRPTAVNGKLKACLSVGMRFMFKATVDDTDSRSLWVMVENKDQFLPFLEIMCSVPPRADIYE